MTRVRQDPPKGAQQPGRNLSNTQTRNSPNNALNGKVERGERKDPPKGFKTFGRGLSGTQTRNSNNNKLNSAR